MQYIFPMKWTVVSICLRITCRGASVLSNASECNRSAVERKVDLRMASCLLSLHFSSLLFACLLCFLTFHAGGRPKWTSATQLLRLKKLLVYFYSGFCPWSDWDLIQPYAQLRIRSSLIRREKGQKKGKGQEESKSKSEWTGWQRAERPEPRAESQNEAKRAESSVHLASETGWVSCSLLFSRRLVFDDCLRVKEDRREKEEELFNTTMKYGP